jgi:signal transduction histidine kinase
MRLSVQLLQRNIDNGKATPEQIQRTTNTLIEQIDALSDIASSFSRYAKLPENHPQPFDLAELVGNVVHLYDNSENIEFHYDFDKTKDHTYNGDKTNLNSAVGNLVKNAVQAIGSKPEGKVFVGLTSTENGFVISVKDNGKGIKEEDKDRIFLPNFTTKSGGSGVGLSLTYNIVQAAGGRISFESKENVGTEFLIELPKQL